MKKIRIIAVGKIKEKYLTDAIEEYSKRLSRFCKLDVIEIEESGVEKEGVLIGQLLKDKPPDFLMDIGGEMVSSDGLSEILDKHYLYSDTAAFIIGGSHGVSTQLKNLAKKRLSFGKITLPHQLFRVVLLEQIYRAFSINSNLPYHK